jgi:hypothetical protein
MKFLSVGLASLFLTGRGVAREHERDGVGPYAFVTS